MAAGALALAVAAARADRRHRRADRSRRRVGRVRIVAARGRSRAGAHGAGGVAAVAVERSAHGGGRARVLRRHLLHPARGVPVVVGMAAHGNGLWLLGHCRRTPAGALSRRRLPVSRQAPLRGVDRADDARHRHRLRAWRRVRGQHPRRGDHHRGAGGGVDRLVTADPARDDRRHPRLRARADRDDEARRRSASAKPSATSTPASCTCCSRASAPSRTSRSPAASRSSRNAFATSSASSAPPSSGARGRRAWPATASKPR